MLYNPSTHNLQRPVVFPFQFPLESHCPVGKRTVAFLVELLLYGCDVVAILVQPLVRKLLLMIDHGVYGMVVHGSLGRLCLVSLLWGEKKGEQQQGEGPGKKRAREESNCQLRRGTPIGLLRRENQLRTRLKHGNLKGVKNERMGGVVL